MRTIQQQRAACQWALPNLGMPPAATAGRRVARAALLRSAPASGWGEHGECAPSSSGIQVSRRSALGLAAVAAPLALWGSGAWPLAAGAAGGGGACQVATAPNGLGWCDLLEGDGPVPFRGAFCKVDYRAELASSGAEFDSSYARKQPLILKLGEREVMEAWDVAILGDEGIPPMREGGKRRIVVPPGPLQAQGTKSLAWMVGLLDALEDAGELPKSGEGVSTLTSTLIFDLELLKRRKR
ncbi:MAG: hypothetical protein J3K34DRAFT_53446 [Monoraphidium minutum]|nr:MAG: hypothetical protein J3K34DRAFT_53446 [Monoraphidium minutum]